MPKRLHRLMIALILTAITLALGTSPSPAASALAELDPSADASLPEGLLEAVREALGPQAAAALASPALTLAQQAKLNAADAEAGDQFGFSVALDGDTAVVGAWQEDPVLGGGRMANGG